MGFQRGDEYEDVAFVLVITTVAIPEFAQKTPPLRYVQSIPLPDLNAGDFDHFAIDVAGNRLFLTGEANNVVEVFDLETNTLAHTIKGVDDPLHALFPIRKNSGVLKIFNADTYAVTDTIKLTEGADSSLYDPAKYCSASLSPSYI